MAANTTRTRADDLRLWEELDALGLVLTNLLDAARVNSGVNPLFQISWDDPGIEAKVVDGPSFRELHDRLWDSAVEYEETPEFERASARSGVLVAYLLNWLASDEGREACLEIAGRNSRAAADALTRAEGST